MVEGAARKEGLGRGGSAGRGPRFREAGQAAAEYAVVVVMIVALAVLLLRTARVWQGLLYAGIARILGITAAFL